MYNTVISDKIVWLLFYVYTHYFKKTSLKQFHLRLTFYVNLFPSFSVSEETVSGMLFLKYVVIVSLALKKLIYYKYV